MLAFNRFFIITFADKAISDKEIKAYATVHIERMETNNPDLILTPLIIPTKTALQGFALATSTDRTKLGVQKAQTAIKDAFKEDLLIQMAKVHGAVVAVYGPKGPELLEIFPHGRSLFRNSTDKDLKENLQQLVNALTGKVPPLGQTILDIATALLTTWTSISQAQGTAKGTKKSTEETCAQLRGTLERQLQKNLLTIAIEFMGDPAKAELYCPQEYLRNRAVPVTPGATTLSAGPFNGETGETVFTMAAQDAEVFRLLRRLMGEADFTVIAENIEAVDGTGTFTDTMPGQGGTFEYVAEALNGTRVGERSGIVTVVQS